MIMTWGTNKAYQEELQEICNLDIPYERLRNQRILITGANGLICSYLIDALMKLNKIKKLNIYITALVRSKETANRRFADYLDLDEFCLLIGDVCQRELFINQKWDYIIHGAGNAHPKAFATQPVETMKSNILGTINILDYAVSQAVMNNVKKILFLSTGEIYGHAMADLEKGWSEGEKGSIDSMDVRSCYPESKRAAETLCQSYYKEYGIDTVVARLSYIYGATIQDDNTRADAQFLRNVLNREDIIMKSEGTQYRSYCYLQDAATAILTILLLAQGGEVYNVANDNSNITIRGYAEKLAEVFGVGICVDIQDTIEKQGYSNMQHEILDVTKLRELGWQPKNNLQMGMKKMKLILKE